MVGSVAIRNASATASPSSTPDDAGAPRGHIDRAERLLVMGMVVVGLLVVGVRVVVVRIVVVLVVGHGSASVADCGRRRGVLRSP